MKLMPIYRGITKVEVTDGANTLFWKDMSTDHIMADQHPRAYSFIVNEDISVKDFLAITSQNMAFHTPLSLQAFDEVRDIQTDTASATLSTSQGNDKWTYAWGSKGYTASQFYTYFFKDIQIHPSYVWLWQSKCTMKIKVFGWLLLSDRLNTKNMLIRRHYTIDGGTDCLLYSNHTEETIEHMAFNCNFSKTCWGMIGITGPTQGSRFDWVAQAKEGWGRPLFMEIFFGAAWSI